MQLFSPRTRTILVYGIGMAVLITVLKVIEYSFMVRDFSTEVSIGLLALFFTALGIWAGLRFTRRGKAGESGFTLNEESLHKLGISKREYEVLVLIDRGLSNREIADTLFISLSTVKSHSSNLFQKLGATRRTQALQKAREVGLLA